MRDAVCLLLACLHFSVPARASPLAASFVVTIDAATGVVEAWNDSSASPAFSGVDAAHVINSAIVALPHPSGGAVLLRAGVYNLTAPISIERSSVHLRGESRGGDLFFSSWNK